MAARRLRTRNNILCRHEYAPRAIEGVCVRGIRQQCQWRLDPEARASKCLRALAACLSRENNPATDLSVATLSRIFFLPAC